MNLDSTRREAVTAAQTMLSAYTSILADGKWGTFTENAYMMAPPAARSAIDELLARYGFTASGLYGSRLATKASGKAAMAAVTDVNSALAAASQESGVDLDILRGFVAIESRGNANAVNGSSRGLFQMQPAAWADAAHFVPGLPPYNQGVFDPLQNARAGAAYLKGNIRSLRALGYTGEMNAAVLYLAHQQGASGFVELWRASQGLEPVSNLVTPIKMMGNPPQDGKGATTDKRSFFERWYAVAVDKVGSKVVA